MRHVGSNPTAIPDTFVEARLAALFHGGDQRSASGKWLRRVAKASPVVPSTAV
jgi:hypothetical protein